MQTEDASGDSKDGEDDELPCVISLIDAYRVVIMYPFNRVYSMDYGPAEE